MTIYLVHECTFPTDFDGELVGVYFFKWAANRIAQELKLEHPDSEVTIREERLFFFI